MAEKNGVSKPLCDSPKMAANTGKNLTPWPKKPQTVALVICDLSALKIVHKSYLKLSETAQNSRNNPNRTDCKLLIPNNWDAATLICKQGSRESRTIRVGYGAEPRSRVKKAQTSFESRAFIQDRLYRQSCLLGTKEGTRSRSRAGRRKPLCDARTTS
jgi:hypothetical protein